MRQPDGDFGGTALSTAWILHIVGIVLGVAGALVLWVFYQLSLMTDGSFPAWMLYASAFGIVGAIGTAFAYSLWARPTLGGRKEDEAPPRVGSIGLMTIVCGAFAFPAFYLGGGLLIIAGLIYFVAAWKMKGERDAAVRSPN
jgi:hypothetical protein